MRIRATVRVREIDREWDKNRDRNRKRDIRVRERLGS